MKTAKPFFDTNVLLYLLSEDNGKADRVEEIMASGGTISVQVLNEFASVGTRKLKMSYAEIRNALQIIRAIVSVEAITLDIHEQGLNIAERFGFSLYDSLIVSAALQSGCQILYSEDLQHGQKIESQLVIQNPFLD